MIPWGRWKSLGHLARSASTQRAVLNFPISGRPVPAAVIQAFAHLKEACAAVNAELGRLEPPVAKAIADAAQTIRAGLNGEGGRWSLARKAGKPWIIFRWMCSKPEVAPAPT